jgi:hypothetical protein
MFLCDFKAKLAKVNHLLYVYDEKASENFRKQKVSGIYLRGGRRKGGIATWEKHEAADKNAIAYIEADEKGEFDTFCGGCNLDEMPEYDIYDLEWGRMVNMGWRSTLLMLAKRGFINLDKARKIFNCPSLGESDYDRLDFWGKMEFARKLGIGYKHKGK